MKHKTAIIAIALLFLFINLKAQDYNGEINDKQNAAISYANIGIKGSNAFAMDLTL